MLGVFLHRQTLYAHELSLGLDRVLLREVLTDVDAQHLAVDHVGADVVVPGEVLGGDTSRERVFGSEQVLADDPFLVRGQRVSDDHVALQLVLRADKLRKLREVGGQRVSDGQRRIDRGTIALERDRGVTLEVRGLLEGSTVIRRRCLRRGSTDRVALRALHAGNISVVGELDLEPLTLFVFHQVILLLELVTELGERSSIGDLRRVEKLVDRVLLGREAMRECRSLVLRRRHVDGERALLVHTLCVPHGLLHLERTGDEGHASGQRVRDRDIACGLAVDRDRVGHLLVQELLAEDHLALIINGDRGELRVVPVLPAAIVEVSELIATLLDDDRLALLLAVDLPRDRLLRRLRHRVNREVQVEAAVRDWNGILKLDRQNSVGEREGLNGLNALWTLRNGEALRYLDDRSVPRGNLAPTESHPKDIGLALDVHRLAVVRGQVARQLQVNSAFRSHSGSGVETGHHQ